MFSGGTTEDDAAAKTSIVEDDERPSSSTATRTTTRTITENDDDDDDESWMQRIRSSAVQWTHSVDLKKEDTYVLLWQICIHRGFITPDSADIDIATTGTGTATIDDVNVFSKSSMSEEGTIGDC